MLHEAAVSFSDFALAGLSAVLAGKLLRRDTERLRIRNWFCVAIGATALAALLGGIAHGFFPDTETFLGALVWRTTLVCIGATGVAALMLASFLLFRPGTVERIRSAALIAFAIYCGVVLFEWQQFVVAIAFYFPAAVLLFVAFLVRWRREHDSFASDGLIAMALTLLAAGVQHFGFGFNPVYLNNNVLYHLVQGAGIIYLYRAGKRWMENLDTSRLRIKAL